MHLDACFARLFYLLGHVAPQHLQVTLFAPCATSVPLHLPLPQFLQPVSPQVDPTVLPLISGIGVCLSGEVINPNNMLA